MKSRAYASPDAELIWLCNADVITTSGVTDNGGIPEDGGDDELEW